MIRYNTENATMDDIKDAAEQANALEFILKNQFGIYLQFFKLCCFLKK